MHVVCSTLVMNVIAIYMYAVVVVKDSVVVRLLSKAISRIMEELHVLL